MKNIITFFLLMVLSVSMAYSTGVNDNTGENSDGKHSGSGSFGAKIILPLSITTYNEFQELGEFVKSSIPYTAEDNEFLEGSFSFVINGEPGHKFYYSISQDLDGTTTGIAEISLQWIIYSNIPNLPAVAGGYNIDDNVINTTNSIISGFDYLDEVDEYGAFYIEASVLSVSTDNSKGGVAEFPQTLTVSYTEI